MSEARSIPRSCTKDRRPTASPGFPCNRSDSLPMTQALVDARYHTDHWLNGRRPPTLLVALRQSRSSVLAKDASSGIVEHNPRGCRICNCPCMWPLLDEPCLCQSLTGKLGNSPTGGSIPTFHHPTAPTRKVVSSHAGLLRFTRSTESWKSGFSLL